MLNRLTEMMSSGPEAQKKELLDFAEAYGYHLQGMLERGNTIRFQVMDREQEMTMPAAAELFCKRYNLLNRRSDESQAVIIDEGEGIFVELDASRH